MVSFAPLAQIIAIATGLVLAGGLGMALADPLRGRPNGRAMQAGCGASAALLGAALVRWVVLA